MTEKISYARCYTIQPSLRGGNLVCVEADVTRNLFNYTVVGLPDKGVQESSERIHGALKNSGLPSPKQGSLKTTISLSPSNIKKEGSHYDVPIALAFLSALEGFPIPDDCLIGGEVTLFGEVLPIQGVLSFAYAALREGKTKLFAPVQHVEILSMFSDLEIYGFSTIRELVNHFKEIEIILPAHPTVFKQSEHPIQYELGDIVGQDHALRSCLIAACGYHNCSFYGPPGTGKTMLARALTDLLPPLSYTEALETYEIYSYTHESFSSLPTRIPFRAPHHTSSYVALLGGGSSVQPGEISLAHNGVLFMDEFPEFETRVLEALRQPLEDKQIVVARAKQTLVLPARFLLITALNPCPCGYRFSEHKVCTCTQQQLLKYRKKLSGPIMDRIDMWIPVLHTSLHNISSNKSTPCTAEYREIIQKTQEMIIERSLRIFKKQIHNSELSLKQLQVLPISDRARQILISSCEKLELSPRVFLKIYKLARTIADIEHSESIQENHVLEALQQRKPPQL